MELAVRWLVVLVLMMARYLLVAGLTYKFLYDWVRDKYYFLKVQKAYPSRKSIRREFLYSLSTLFVFSLTGIILFIAKKYGWSKMYADVDEYGWGYFFLSVLLAIVIHDTYFYWTHRLMHHKYVFKLVHRVHHLSHNPTPLAAFSFHPLEAIIEASVLPLIAFLIPIHRGAIMIFLFYMILMNVMGHCGFEFFPKWFLRSWMGKVQNTSVHHNMHHQYAKGNYGLYFNFWDRIMKTNHPEYRQRFEEVTSRPMEQKVLAEDAVIH